MQGAARLAVSVAPRSGGYIPPGADDLISYPSSPLITRTRSETESGRSEARAGLPSRSTTA